MADYYLNNAYKGAENYSGCNVQAGTLTTLRASVGTFDNVSDAVDEPFWIVTAGDGTDATIGIYKVQTVAGDGSSVVLDRNITTGAETGITAMGVAYNGLAEVPGSGNGPFATFGYAFDQMGDDDTLWVKSNNGYIWHQDADPGEDIDDIDQFKERVLVSVVPNWDRGYHVWIRAYKNNISDMDFGGAFYGGALDAYKSENGLASQMSNSLAEWCDLDADDQGTELFSVFVNANIEFHNFRFRNTTTGTPADVKLVLYTSANNCVMFNCKFKGPCWFAVGNSGIGNLFVDCWFGDVAYTSVMWMSVMNDVDFLGCVIECVPNGIDMATRTRVYSCVFVGGNIALIAQGASYVGNCLFYNQSIAGIISQGVNNPTLVEYNNIFLPSTDSGYAVHIHDDGAMVFSKNSMAAALNGVDFSVPPWFDDNGSRDIRDPSCVANANIGLRDPANADFVLLASSILDTGLFMSGHSSSVGPLFMPRRPPKGIRDLVTDGVGGF